ncbi:KamA family radical SAM protein [Candidatus Pacearchaeota archaeon]|nr:KamA family radical SAM protein [Candidatus Pacearchaeota archaeon]
MSWQEQLRNGVKTVEDLDSYAKLNAEEKLRLSKVIDAFPLLITPYYASLVDWKNPNDPIRKIIVPSESEFSEEGLFDPSNEKSNTVLPSLQHKYRNTALLLSTSNCAGYCRFCFRRRLKENCDSVAEKKDELNEVFEYIKSHPEIDNVLISGGDSLVLSNERLDFILGKISKINHVKMIRLATRVPVFLPQRISEDKELLEILTKYNKKKQIYVITHFNHPDEITTESIKTVKLLINNGIQVRNQTVLLKGVNDDADVLAKLFNELVFNGVVTYYLFQCRPVKKSSHFKIPLNEGWKLFEGAKKQVSGLAKTVRYAMSHTTGKVEICGILENKIYLKYIQAKKYEDIGKFMIKKLPKNKDAYWFDDLIE